MDTLDTRFSKAGPVSSTGGKIRGRLGSLLPSHINPNQPNMVQGEYTFGGLADSYYEYLVQSPLCSITVCIQDTDACRGSLTDQTSSIDEFCHSTICKDVSRID